MSSMVLRIVVATIVAGALSIPRAASAQSAASPCQKGLARALMGDTPGALAIFENLLAKNPHDACALANLGNLALISGRARTASNYYSRASQADTSDAGLLLNAAIARAMMCDEANALLMAERAIQRVGDSKAALSLLGVGSDDSVDGQPSRAGDLSSRLIRAVAPNCGKPLDPSLVRGLLERAATRLSADSLGRRAAGGEVPISSYPIYWKH